jgi:hypothetical protein
VTSTPKAIRQRLYDDFEFYAKHCVKIRPKVGPVASFILNRPQQRLQKLIDEQMATTGRVRIIILKARQQGFSTYVHAWQYWMLSQRPAKKGLVVAHVADSTRALFDMYKRTHSEMPEVVKPKDKYSSRRELSFPTLDTSLMVATAGGDNIARGETITNCHLSEVAFWPNATAKDNFNALLAAVPDAPDTSVFVESTANGMSGLLYELWLGALEGTNGFTPFFSPWFDSPEYTVEGHEDFELTLEEEDLVEAYGLTKGQLTFRRQRIASTSTEQFKQEYPSNADEAFIASGRPVFNPDQLHGMLKTASQPIERMALEEDVLRVHPRGELLVYRRREPDQRYYIGADVAMGVKNGDYSVAQVLDRKKRRVAMWRGHIHPDRFADVLYAMGMYFNEARIVVENNNHGLYTAVRLGRDLAYPDTYTAVGEGQLNDQDSFIIGFNTNAKTKPLIIDRLRAAMREDEVSHLDETTIREMLSFIVTESGKMKAEEGVHDDTVMALALANHIHDGAFEPIIVTDDYYVEAL